MYQKYQKAFAKERHYAPAIPYLIGRRILGLEPLTGLIGSLYSTCGRDHLKRALITLLTITKTDVPDEVKFLKGQPTWRTQMTTAE